MITEPQPPNSVVFVVDASDAGTPCLAQAFSLLRQMARLLPRFQDQRLMFLGSGHTCPLDDFERHWPAWVRENAGRLSVVSPVYEALEGSPQTIVVLSACPIFDLSDWRDSLQFQLTLFVRLGETSLGTPVTMHAPHVDTLCHDIQSRHAEIGYAGSSAAVPHDESTRAGSSGNASSRKSMSSPSSSEVRLICDRTGFPFLRITNSAVSLLPVTWRQLELRLSEPGGRSSVWYASVLADAASDATNSVGTDAGNISHERRGTWQSFRDEDREDIFMNGVTTDEAIDYVRWLKGSTSHVYDFDLPQADLWRAAAEWMQARPFDADSRRLIADCGASAAALAIIDRLITQVRPKTWFDLALFKNCLFEWVRDRRGEFGGLGAPRIARLRHTFNPFDPRAEPVRYMQPGRPQLFGLRPIVLCDELI